MAAPFLMFRAVALTLRVGLAFAAAHLLDGCALSLMLRAVALALRVGLAFAAAHFLDGCALPGLHSQPLMGNVAAS